MDAETANQLIELNRQFYQTFSEQFAATRRRLQPGVKRIIQDLPLVGSILDIGCGNGEVTRALHANGFRGQYVGIDFSSELLDIARRDCKFEKAVFVPVDLTWSDWVSSLPSSEYDAILAFAVLHHIPGEHRRDQILNNINRLLSPGGRFYHSEWQFLNSPRLRQRIQPWSRIGLSEEQVDQGDYLMDWKHDGYALRYVHHFDIAELDHLARKCGFRILETFWSDGENDRLGLYQAWEVESL